MIVNMGCNHGITVVYFRRGVTTMLQLKTKEHVDDLQQFHVPAE